MTKHLSGKNGKPRVLKKSRLAGVVSAVALFAVGISTGSITSAGADIADVDALSSGDVAGLAVDVDGAMRDDKIALYETYKAEIRVAGCMAKEGFEYSAAAKFPAGAVVSVAQDMSVAASSANSDGASQNSTYTEQLKRRELDSYYKALYGESLGSVEFHEKTGGPVSYTHLTLPTICSV